MLAQLGGLSPHPDGSKGVWRSGIIATVHTGVQQPSVTLPVNLAQNDWENDWEYWEMQGKKLKDFLGRSIRFC